MFDFQPLFDQLQKNYAQWLCKGMTPTPYQMKMIAEYQNGIAAPDQSAKYIRIVLWHGTNAASVWGFIVNIDNDPKFKRGDILKAAGWKVPAKNFARGNINNPADIAKCEWTSAK